MVLFGLVVKQIMTERGIYHSAYSVERGKKLRNINQIRGEGENGMKERVARATRGGAFSALYVDLDRAQ